MKSAVSSNFAAVLFAVLIATWGAIGNAQTVGRTRGTFAVSPSGAATYTIPIWAPPGPKGLQPHVALVYNSQSGNGYVGVGWNLSGLSAIYRCNLTYAQDATSNPVNPPPGVNNALAPAAVTLTTSDGYCLDGQRLRLTSGTYGTAGSTYQTEIANFENVTAYGSAGNGPAYFIVQTPDGRSLQYGNGGNSQVLASGQSTALSWLLNEVTDPAGNTMTIAYCPTGTTQGSACPSAALQGTTVPYQISWTPEEHGSSTYNYTMTFSYNANALPPAGYVANTPVENPDLLASITIDSSGSQVKEYVLTYTQSATTARDVLTQVQECSTSASTCLYPTTISYAPTTPGVSTSASTGISSPLPSAWRSFAAHYDFNGDGYMDLVYSNGTNWYVAFGSASGYGTPVNTGISGTLGLSVLFGDLLGTGQDGILANNGSTWSYYTWNGSSFVGTSTSLSVDSTGTQYGLADINGDGLPDLVELKGPLSNVTVTTRLNTSSGSTPSFSSSVVTAATIGNVLGALLITPDFQAGNLRSFDFNGDGRQDLAIDVMTCAGSYGGTCIEYETTQSEMISQSGGTFSLQFLNAGASSSPSITVSTIFANINNDACTDAVLYGEAVYISACNGSTAVTLPTTYPVVGVMDWNGDGLGDLIEDEYGTLYVQLSSATGFGAATATSLTYASNCTYIGFDANGDGLDDLGCVSTQSGTNGFAYYLHNNANLPPDLVSSITDGYGNFAEPSYSSLVRGWYDEISGTNASYPYKGYIGPTYVVNYVTYSDPTSSSGGTYQHAFWYGGAWMNLQGRGLTPFYWVQLGDRRDSTNYYTYYERAFPETGLPSQVSRYAANADNIWQTLTTAAYTTLSSTPYEERYFPYLSNATTTHSEVNAQSPVYGAVISTSSTNYSYDDYGNPTSIATTLTDDDPGSPYYGDSWTTTTTNTPDANTSTWCLNLFTETQVAYTATIGGSITRTKTFTPDTTNCRYTQIVTEPSSSSYKVTEALAYDAFGNVNSDTVTGVNMTARTTTMNWGTTGQLPASVTDPTGATTTFTYNWNFGLVSNSEDANNLTTSWYYDGFGRKTQENRPDRTYTVWGYEACASWGGCLLGSSTLAIAHWRYNADGSVLTSGTTYFDELQRPVITNGWLLANPWRLDVRYDNLGRVVERSAPCLWSQVTTTCTYWTTMSYDLLNRVTEMQRPVNQSSGQTTCNPATLPPASGCQGTSYSYSGPTTVVTDPQNNTRTTVTDVNGWLRAVKDDYGYTVTRAYDAAGSTTGVTDSQGDPLWSGTYAYGLKPFLTSATDMDLGAWNYTIDALGERTAWTDAKGQSFGESYDALSRPSSRSEPDLFTQWTWGSSASSHNIGKLASVCTGTGTNPTNCTSAPGYSESETYDSDGRLYERAIALPSAGTFTYSWQYNSTTGLLNTLTYPTSTSGYAFEVEYGYTNGILSSVKDISDSPNVTIWQANTQNPDGQITEETLGNGIVTNRTYDAVTHWLGSLQAGVSGGSGVKNLAFLYDEMGNVTQRQDNNQSLTENIYYDDDYRLSYTQLNGTQNLSISYDPTGNITSRSDVAGGASWTYDPNRKHAVTEAGSSSYTYSYDANGNMTSREGSTIGWSTYNYPTSISAGSGSTAESISLYYGPGRQRWYQYYSGNSTTEGTYYAANLLEIVTSGSVMNYRHYVYAGNEPVAVYSRTSSGTNTFNYMLSDHQGSVAALTNSSGGTAVSESFTPYGNRRDPSTWSPWSGTSGNQDLITAAGITRQGYTFQTQLGLWMGMNHMNGRVEDSIIGRFLSPDPQIPDPTNPQSYNRYSYVRNNPLTEIDPTGFDDQNGTVGGMPTVQVQGSPILDPVPVGFVFSPSAPNGVAALGAQITALSWAQSMLPTVDISAPKQNSPYTPGTVDTSFLGAATLAAFNGVFYAPASQGFWSQLWATLTGHPLVALAALGTIAVTGGPEDPLGDALASAEIAAAEAAEGTNTIVLGLEDYGLQQTATQIGGQTLMGDVNWQSTLLTGLGDANTNIVVSLDGVSGDTVYSQFMNAAQQGLAGPATEGNFFNWEMGQIYQAGRQGSVTFMQGGQIVPNPFL